MIPTVLALLLLASVQGQDYELVWEDNFDGDSIDLSKWDHEITAWGGGNSEFQFYADDPMNSYVKDGKLFITPTLLETNTNPDTGEPYGPDFMVNGILDVEAMYGRCTNTDNGGCYRTGENGDIPPIMSARLRSYERFFFKYGRTEILAKMPVGDWMWPAMWMLPEFWVYGDWPLSGEIDLTESVSNRDYVNATDGSWFGIQKMGNTLHWGVSPDHNRWHLTHGTKKLHEQVLEVSNWALLLPLSQRSTNEAENYGDFFHLYTMEWDENGLVFDIDGVEVVRCPDPLINENPDWVDWYTFGSPWEGDPENPWEDGTNMTPFDEDFHFILNVAVGGTNGFIPDDGINRGGEYPKPWTNDDSYVDAMQKFYNSQADWLWTWAETEGENAAMQVEYVRVYQRVDKK